MTSGKRPEFENDTPPDSADSVKSQVEPPAKSLQAFQELFAKVKQDGEKERTEPSTLVQKYQLNEPFEKIKKKELIEPFEVIKRDELDEDFTVINKGDVPKPHPLEANGKHYGTPATGRGSKWNIFASDKQVAADQKAAADKKWAAEKREKMEKGL